MKSFWKFATRGGRPWLTHSVTLLVSEEPLLAAVPALCGLVGQELADVPVEIEHELEHELRHLRAVEAAGGCEHDVLGQVRQRLDMVGAGGERLDQAQPRHGGDEACEDLISPDHQDLARRCERQCLGGLVRAVKTQLGKLRAEMRGKDIRVPSNDQHFEGHREGGT